MARGAAYDDGVPEVLPRTSIGPDPYQRVQAPADAFGAGIGQGLEHLGKGALDASTFFGQVAAQDAANGWEAEANKILYGDPNTPGDRGFYGKEGRDALDAMPGTIERLRQLREETKAGLLTPDQQLRFDERTFRVNNFYNEAIGRVYDREFKTYTTATNKATADLALSAITANPNDDTLFESKRESLRGAAIKQAQTLYGMQPGPEITSSALQRADQDAIAARIHGLEDTDPAKAQALFDENRATLAGRRDFEALAHRLQTRTEKALGDSIFQGAMGLQSGAPQTSGGFSVGGAIPRRIAETAAAQNVDPTLALTTAQIESSMGQNVGSRGNIFQLGGTEWRSVGGGRMGEPDTDIRNGVAFLAQKKQELAAALGREPQPWEIYLAHQQGTGGAVALLNHPDEAAGTVVRPENIAKNGGDPNAPAAAFVGKWRDRFTQVAANIGGATGAAAEQPPVAVGDSIAAHLIRFAGAEGKEDRTAVRSYRPGDTAVAGYTPSEILNQVIPAIPTEQIKGKPVVLSTGASNAPSQLDVIPQQIAALKDRGATSVTLLGVGTAAPVAGVNDKLAQIAQENGAGWAGPLRRVASDGIHSSDNAALLRQARAAMPATGDAAGSVPAPAPDQLVGQAPQPGQTPPVMPPPGMADLSRAEAELAQRHARALLAIENDPRSAANPAAMAHAQQRADLDFRSRQIAIAAQKQAIAEASNAALDGYVQRMMKGEVSPAIVQEVANDNRLNAQNRENLWRIYDAHTKKGTDGDTVKYGPQFFNYFQRVTLPDSDPNRIRDPSQILALAVPKPDGTQELTLAGADKLRQELAAAQGSPEGAAFVKRKADFLKGIEPQIDKSEFTGIPDQQGKERFYRFGFMLDETIDEYRKAGKNPNDLLNPKKPDYLGAPETVQPYQGPLAQKLRDALGAATAAPGSAPAVDLTTQAGIIAAYRAGRIDRATASRTLIARGFAAPPSAAPPASTAPQAPFR